MKLGKCEAAEGVREGKRGFPMATGSGKRDNCNHKALTWAFPA
jgi:hypothetical protein